MADASQLASLLAEVTSLNEKIDSLKVVVERLQKSLVAIIEDEQCSLNENLALMKSLDELWAEPQPQTNPQVASPTFQSSNSSSEANVDPPKYRPMKHLVVTDAGGQWVTDRLPKDDYSFPEYEVDPEDPIESVDDLLSKPVGRKLIVGQNMFREDGDPKSDD